MNMHPGSVDIHGTSVESGVTSYLQSQGHSTSSGDHLLNASGGGFAPFALQRPTVAPIVSPSSMPGSKSLLERVFGGVTKRSSMTSDTVLPETVPFPQPLTLDPQMSYSDWRNPSITPFIERPTSSRERNLSSPEGLLHPRRPDLIALESSRTLMDHVDYSRPILPEARLTRESSNTSDTKSTVKTQNTEGQADANNT